MAIRYLRPATIALAAMGMALALPGAADTIRFTNGPYQVVAHGTVDAEVLLLDDSGLPRAGERVSFRAFNSEFAIPRDTYQEVVTDSAGRARTSWRMGECFGDIGLRAEAAGLSAHADVAILARAGDSYRVEVLSGGFQRTRPNTFFPEPITVRVLDFFGNPVPAGESVSFEVRPEGSLIWGVLDAQSSTWPARTDAAGIAQAAPPYVSGSTGQAQGVAVRTQLDACRMSSWNPVASMVAEGLPPARYVPMTGDRQEVLVGAVSNPFVVRVTDVDGVPVPRALVWWDAAASASGGHWIGIPASLADSQGVATSPLIRAPATPGTTVIGVVGSSTSFHLLAVNRLTPTAEAPAVRDLWWAGPSENGWGMSISQQGESLFLVIYTYDGSGAPTWFVIPGGEWNQDRTVFSGAAYRPRGSPYFAYDASRFMAGDAIGNVTLTFADAGHATLDYTLSGAKGRKSIRRQPFGAGASASGDLWWGSAAQNGWGLSVVRQGDALFSTWFTYDATGTPTWFVMPSGTWTDASTYEGRVYRTTGSPWVGTTYDAAALRVHDAGAYRLRFNGEAATFDFNVEGHGGTLSLTRQFF